MKIFLDADPETRALRRYQELQGLGMAVSREDVGEEVDRRDERDRTRAESPLVAARDAIVIDTSKLDLEGQIQAVLAAVRAHPRFPDLGPQD